MKIIKPKRNANGTYEGLIYKNVKKDLISLKIDNAKIMSVKVVQGDHYLFIKHKTIAKEVYDINSDVISNVKENCNAWFRNGLSGELIEDYFTSNIIYDKELGQVIKFKCLNDLSDLQENTAVNISITLKNIRFYKQKFVIEWDIDEIEVIDPVALIDLEDADSYSDDIPVPLEEDILSLREHYLSLINDALEKVENEKADILRRESILVGFSEKVGQANDFSQLSSLCNDLDEIFQ